MSVALISLIHGLLCGLVGWLAASVHYGKMPGMEEEDEEISVGLGDGAQRVGRVADSGTERRRQSDGEEPESRVE